MFTACENIDHPPIDKISWASKNVYYTKVLVSLAALHIMVLINCCFIVRPQSI
ncbi:MAG: hypothetical protein JWP44_2303 [Mucilaginibacter sp.]|nr:hypothetical protein [Mucilaginibacter sp.]